jgi:hypothetical protein
MAKERARLSIKSQEVKREKKGSNKRRKWLKKELNK